MIALSDAVAAQMLADAPPLDFEAVVVRSDAERDVRTFRPERVPAASMVVDDLDAPTDALRGQ